MWYESVWNELLKGLLNALLAVLAFNSFGKLFVACATFSRKSLNEFRRKQFSLAPVSLGVGGVMIYCVFACALSYGISVLLLPLLLFDFMVVYLRFSRSGFEAKRFRTFYEISGRSELVLALCAFLILAVFLTLKSIGPGGRFQFISEDYGYYARLAEAMADSGVENPVETAAHFLGFVETSPAPYHYLDLWFAAYPFVGELAAPVSIQFVFPLICFFVAYLGFFAYLRGEGAQTWPSAYIAVLALLTCSPLMIARLFGASVSGLAYPPEMLSPFGGLKLAAIVAGFSILLLLIQGRRYAQGAALVSIVFFCNAQGAALAAWYGAALAIQAARQPSDRIIWFLRQAAPGLFAAALWVGFLLIHGEKEAVGAPHRGSLLTAINIAGRTTLEYVVIIGTAALPLAALIGKKALLKVWREPGTRAQLFTWFLLPLSGIGLWAAASLRIPFDTVQLAYGASAVTLTGLIVLLSGALARNAPEKLGIVGIMLAGLTAVSFIWAGKSAANDRWRLAPDFVARLEDASKNMSRVGLFFFTKESMIDKHLFYKLKPENALPPELFLPDRLKACVPASIDEIPLDSTNLVYAHFKQRNMFQQYVLEKNYKNAEAAALNFMQSHNINWAFAQGENAIPPELRPLVKKRFIDDRSGYEVVVFDLASQ